MIDRKLDLFLNPLLNRFQTTLSNRAFFACFPIISHFILIKTAPSSSPFLQTATAAVTNWQKVRRAVLNVARAAREGKTNAATFFQDDGDNARASVSGSNLESGEGKRAAAAAKSQLRWEGTKFIGILDIFGFEIFEKNSFEQLCINYANERLQQLFNTATFRAEEEAYKKEGVPYDPVMFADNADVLELIDKRPDGILPVLDEEVVLPRTTDDTFLRKLGERHERKHKRYQRPKGNASRTGYENNNE